MKRLLCLVLMLGMCIFNAVAEEGMEAEESEGLSFVESDAPYDGIWQPFEDGFMLYLPQGWVAIELTDAQREAGLFYRADSADGLMNLAVGYMRAGNLTTVNDLARDFEAVGFSNVIRLDLNGIPAISFDRPGEDYRGVAFFHPVYPDYALYVYLSPLAPEDGKTAQIGTALLASISPNRVSQDMLKNN